MGLGDWFRAARAMAPPADLRAALIDAVESKNSRVTSALFRTHHDEIRASFAAWSTVPIDTRNDERALTGYAEMLITVARLFEQEGDEGPMQSLRGDPIANPIDQWHTTIEAAQALADQDRHAEAAAILSELLATMEGLRGSAIDFYRPRVLGKLGVALYQSGATERAREVTTEAREFCRRIGDEEGVAAYTANLETMAAD